MTHGVLTALARYHWPGNVRELQNVMAGLAVSAPARGQVKANQLPPVIAGATGPSTTRHPNIAAIYGIEEFEVGPALVLELVEGPTLADRIVSGMMPLTNIVAHRLAAYGCS